MKRRRSKMDRALEALAQALLQMSREELEEFEARDAQEEQRKAKRVTKADINAQAVQHAVDDIPDFLVDAIDRATRARKR